VSGARKRQENIGEKCRWHAKNVSDSETQTELRRLPALTGTFIVTLDRYERQRLMKQSDIYRQNAENRMHMAEAAEGEPAYNRFKRMEAAWLALAEEQDWLDGEQSPAAAGP
jgi:hypothetical protein